MFVTHLLYRIIYSFHMLTVTVHTEVLEGVNSIYKHKMHFM